VVLVPRFPLFRVMVMSQVANGVLLPFVLIFVLLLINDKELMGKYTNSRWYNVVSWFTVGIMIVLTIAMLAAQERRCSAGFTRIRWGRSKPRSIGPSSACLSGGNTG
jgi:hypothetical protein